jgi:O-antigen ligase
VVLALIIALLPPSWVTVLVLGAIVLVVTLVHPQFGVLLILPAVPFASLRQVTVGVMNVGASEALVVLVLAAWLMRMVAQRETRIELPPLALPLAILIGAMSLSLLGTTSMQHSLKEILKWIEILALYLLVANEMDARWTTAVVFVALGTGALAALHGIYQFLFQVGPEEFILFGRFMRAFGTFEQPNPYAGYLGVTLPLAVGLIVAGLVRAGGRVGWKWMVWAGVSGALMAAALAMSWSRGAWLGFAAAVAAIALAAVARSGRGAVLATLFLLLIVYGLLAGGLATLPPVIVQRFSDFVPYLGVTEVRGVEITDANFAVLERVAHWQSAALMWTDRPWLGVGIGNYEVVYPDYALPLWPLPLGHAHNYYLNAAAETGVLGLGAYVVLWAAALVVAWKAARQTSGLQWGVALGVLGILAHLSTHNLFDNLYVHAIYLQVAVLLGVIATYGGNKRLD